MFQEELWERTLPIKEGHGGVLVPAQGGVQGAPHGHSKKELFHELSHKGTHSMKESILRRKC